MAKKFDVKFDDVEAFKKANPQLTVSKEIPAHTEVSPNYAAIRAILRSGQKLEGVKLVEVATSSANPPANGTGESSTEAEDALTADKGDQSPKPTLRQKMTGAPRNN